MVTSRDEEDHDGAPAGREDDGDLPGDSGQKRRCKMAHWVRKNDAKLMAQLI